MNDTAISIDSQNINDQLLDSISILALPVKLTLRGLPCRTTNENEIYDDAIRSIIALITSKADNPV
jgi:hypothetical protein